MNTADVVALATETQPVIVEVWERSPYGTDRLRVRHFVRDASQGRGLLSPHGGYVVLRYGENWTQTCTTASMPGYLPPTMDYTKAREPMPVTVVA